MSKSNKIKIIEMINYMHLWKELYLPYELVGINGRYRTSYLYKDDKVSPLKWRFFMKRINKLIKEYFKI